MTNPTDSDRATAERIVIDAMIGGKLTGVAALRDAIAAALASEREACVAQFPEDDSVFSSMAIRRRIRAFPL